MEIWSQIFIISVRLFEIILDVEETVFKAYKFPIVPFASISFKFAVSSFSHHIILSEARTYMISDLHRPGIKNDSQNKPRSGNRTVKWLNMLLFKEEVQVCSPLLDHESSLHSSAAVWKELQLRFALSLLQHLQVRYALIRVTAKYPYTSEMRTSLISF